MTPSSGNGLMVFDTPDGIETFRLLSIKGRLKLEIQTGLRWRIATAPIVRKIIGSTTKNKVKLLAEYEQYLRDRGIIVVKVD